MIDPVLFVAIDTSLSISVNMEKRKQFSIKRTQYEEVSPTVIFACYEKKETLIRTYFFKEHLILFVEVTPYIQLFEEMFGKCITEMDVWATDMTPDILIPNFEKVIAQKGQGYTESPYFHIYGQRYWHDDAMIIGNKTALKELRDAIDNALRYGEARIGPLSRDGEGYNLFISCMPGETENNEDWKQIRLPYHDREMYEPDDDNEVDPFDYLKFYKSLLSR